VSTSAAASGITGNNFTYGLTVQNAGPLAATAAVLSDNIPSGATFQSVATSQGTCSGGAIVLCDLGNLNSAASANVQISVILSAPGVLTNTAFVSAPQGDSNFANNTSITTATVSGSLYNPVPSLISISPAFAQAGSTSFTLTVNGSNFVAGSAVELNSTPLPTAFISASKLTATVDATYVSSMGWSWINVTSPLPGGGTSLSALLTTYKVISLDVNRMVFDPFTRKLYATLPSTATQAAGNSLVSIDPMAGVLGTPINIGSEPKVIAESNDGQYLYVGLDGSQSLTRFDLSSSTQGPVYPILFPNGGSSVQVAARDIAVSPSNDNVLAVDGPYGGPIGIFDISGSTGTMRPTVAQGYPGSSLAFGSDSLLYSFDTDTSAAEFYRWDISSSGLTLDNNTGYTLNAIGNYKLVDGRVYGFAGGVANPSTTPPTQLGRFTISSAQGSGQVIEGFGVAPDPAIGRVFFLGETLAGTANPVLLSYDSSQYVLLNMQQFTGAIQGEDLVRWGRDGLAWHTNLGGGFGNSTPGSGQIFLMRGPFILPEWGTINPAPGLVSVSPSSATAGSVNLSVTVTGSNFVPGAVLTWNGVERTTTFVDSSHLTVAIPASDISHSSTTTLVVNNPGSANSNSISFTIN
jgi:uncharacterized repeat protein (TIGR01451 family)